MPTLLQIERNRRLRAAGAFVFALFITSTHSQAQSQPPFRLELLSPLHLRVAPGQSVVHTLRIRNVGTSTSSLRVIGSLNLRNRFSNFPYLFGQPSDARCGTMSPEGDDVVEMTTAPLAPGATLDCQWTIRRPVQSDFDTDLVWTTSATPVSWTPATFIGTLTDVSMSTQKRSFTIDPSGRGVATVELFVQNRASIAIGTQEISLGSGDVTLVSSNGPGGCGQMLPDSFGGRYEIPPIQPVEVFRCTFTVQTRLPYSSPESAIMMIGREQFAINGAMLLDTNDTDNVSLFEMSPDGVIAAPVSLDTLDRKWLFVLSLLVGLVALVALGFRARSRAGEPR